MGWKGYLLGEADKYDPDRTITGGIACDVDDASIKSCRWFFAESRGVCKMVLRRIEEERKGVNK